MNIEPGIPTIKNSPEQFTGDMWVDPIVAPDNADQRMTVATVRFAPGARTAAATTTLLGHVTDQDYAGATQAQTDHGGRA
jgi:hypothetical protein